MPSTPQARPALTHTSSRVVYSALRPAVVERSRRRGAIRALNFARLRHAASPCRASPLIIAVHFSAIMIVGAFVFVEVTAGITEASLPRSPSSPCTLSSSSTTAIACEPVRQVQLA